MPFVPAIVSNLLAIGLYNGLESWPSWVSTEFVLTSNIVWLSVIAGGILTVYNLDLEMRWHYFLLCKHDKLLHHENTGNSILVSEIKKARRNTITS